MVDPPPTMTTEVTVLLEDVNDETPTFKAAHYVAEIAEGAQFNSPVNLIGDAIPEVYDHDQVRTPWLPSTTLLSVPFGKGASTLLTFFSFFCFLFFFFLLVELGFLDFPCICYFSSFWYFLFIRIFLFFIISGIIFSGEVVVYSQTYF